MPRGIYKRRRAVEESTPANPKKILIKCGNQYIDPEEVAAIKEAKHGLFIVKLKSDPDPEYPIWVLEADIAGLIAYFDIKEITA